ncbi:multidrug efflux RND transporter permease subunit [Salinisphaera hydrothermalis]|uniref:Multidrug efflux transporter protein n=1 Tax=Salinisphaera hydrothermalis (strain C41B8) TaxID=1304275 RepID=A0A084IHY3_SALHC|nr:multidrug efflux RND transporter permease subunit [Salinisphaera hydrothermalis]KEZ76317.1 multidrug efflux transporter protein [Salinisphaera hydrothermalis C41B8]
MRVSDAFISRPIATSLLALAVLLSGILGYRFLPISSLPQVDFPTIQVSTRLPGASADTVARLITAPLEHQLGQIQGLSDMTSTSSMGRSQITLQFVLGRDIDAAAQDVQDAINEANGNLPNNLPYPPSYSKVNPADTPILTLALTSKNLPIQRLSDVADTLLAQRLSEVGGVGHVTVEGGIRPAVRIQADLPQLASYGLGLETLRSAISAANTNQSKGSLSGAVKAYTIGANDQLADAAAYRNVVVAYKNGAPVRLDDVAHIVSGVEDNKVAAHFNGKPAVVLDVQRQPGANIVATVDALKAKLPELRSAMPSGVNMQIVSDRTGTIRASVRDVQFTLVISVMLVVLVVLLFLRSLSATLIAGVALPLSLIATFGVMWAAGFSLDNLSLMALTIATGFVVDDAIVMIENIVRHLEAGERPMTAAYKGAGEIGFTVISLTLSLIAVFIPLLLMPGIVGRLFREFALTLSVSVVVSAIVSLTLTPMMCARLLSTKQRAPGRFSRAADRAVTRLTRGYEHSLRWVLAHRAATLWVTVATLALTILLYIVVPKGFLPQEDTGLLTAQTRADDAVSFDAMKRVQSQVDAAVKRDPDVAAVTSTVGVSATNATPNVGSMSIVLKPRGERSHDLDTTMADLKQRVANIPGVNVVFKAVQSIQIATTNGPTQYQYVLTDSDSDRLTQWSNRLTHALGNVPEVRNVSSDIDNTGPRVKIDVDRSAAGRLGVTMQSVDDTLYDAFGQRQISTIYGQANQYRVVLEAAPRYQTDPSVLSNLYVPASDGTQIPLRSVASTQLTTAPLAIQHQEQFPAATLNFDLAPGVSLGQAINAIQSTEQSIGMPSAIQGTFVGSAAEFAKSLSVEPWLILAAVIVIYIVLGVLYESFIHPFTILTTLPSAGVGALLALLAFGYDLSVVALIGIILLMGIVKKNAIMMIDFALDAERDRGLAPDDAIFEAALRRFRPIMMTTLAALLGALPLALSHNVGSELRVPLGVTIIGGLLLSQVMTLYTTPVIYLAMDRVKARTERSRLGRYLGANAERGPGLAPRQR